ncbi:MAG TPA: hypothetical protein VME17_20635 [Bryobacteraceae bacterium]|nr:hypothetical protein [Bryobacteraceae bacterium]
MGDEIHSLNDSGALGGIIRRGRRRQIAHLLIHSASFAAVIALGGAILLLIVGAQILAWYWLAILFAAGLGAGAYRLRASILTPYQVAQSLDRRLSLNDALSTAYYFSGHPDQRGARPDFIHAQRDDAEQIARSVDMQRGMPFLLPRSAYINLALVLVAVGMFGLRYGIKRSLDLRSPLVSLNLDSFFGNPKVADVRDHNPRNPDGGRRDPSSPDNPWDSKTSDLDPTADASRESVEDPVPSNAKASPDGSAKADAKSTEQLPPGANPLDSGEKGQSSLPSDTNSNSSAGADSKSGQQSGSKDAKDGKEGNQSGNPADNSSLGSKLRDALSNLLAKMKPQSKPGAGKPNDSSQSASSRSPQQQGEKQEGDSKSPGQEQADASANSQSQGEQQQGGKQQASQGKSDGRSNNQPNSPDGKSGIGKQDGDKAAREAAELAAMGKLSEIIGKRAANITGEVMVEVSSGKQQLKTQYSDRDAAHADTGGEINRDEVPLAYQQYVQQYFTQMRKMPASKAKDAAPDTKAPDSKAGTTPSSAP